MARSILKLLLGRHLLWTALIGGVAVVLCALPLLSLLAYPFVLVISIVAALGAAHLGSFTVGQARSEDAGLLLATREPLPALLLLSGQAAMRGLSLLALPLLIVLLNGFRVRNCDLLTGLLFYAVMPTVGVVLAAATGVFWALLIPYRAFATTCALLTVIAFWLLAGCDIYFSPAVFVYDPFFGYFPGALYDEGVAVRTPLLLYRFYNLLWLGLGGSLLALLFDPATVRVRLERLRWSRPYLLVVLGFFTAGATMFLNSDRLGFSTSPRYIARQLGAVRRTPHFDIHHQAKLTRQQVDRLAQDHEFHYAQLSALLGVKPPRFRSYIFGSAEQKRQLMGAATTYIAKPWRGEIYLQHERLPHPVLRHEMAHLFAATFGDAIFGVSARWRNVAIPVPLINFGLIEGLAVALDWPASGEATIHQRAAALVRLDLAPPVPGLFAFQFFGYSSRRAYTTAGSFCRFLIDTHGIDRFKQLYRNGGKFEQTYGVPLAKLAAAWRRFMASVDLSKQQLVLAREIFRRPSIFHRVCPHTVARHREAASKHLSRKEHAIADVILEKICQFDPGDPNHILARLDAQAGAGRLQSASALATKLLAHPALSKPLERRVRCRIGDLLWMSGDVRGAAAAYDRAALFPASAGHRRLLALRQWALVHPNPAVRRTLRAYLVEADLLGKRDGARDLHLTHTLARELSRSSVGDYLVGLQLSNHGHCDEAIPALRRALLHGRRLPNDDFIAKAYLSLGRCQYLEGHLADAEQTFSALVARSALPAGLELVASSWTQRVRWRVTP